MGDFDLRPLIWFGAIVVLFLWGSWELIDWLWIDDSIHSYTPITPELKIIVKDNIVDTMYIYRKP